MFRSARTPSAIASLLLLAVSVGGCSGSSNTPASSAPAAVACDPGRLDAFVDSIQNVTYDYEPVDTPQVQARMADLVVGRFVGVVPGRAGRATGSQGTLTVAVDEVLSGEADAVTDGLVFVELPMQAGDIEAAQRSLPATRVLLFLEDRSVIDGRDLPGGRPPDAPIFAPFVQGVILEACPGYVSALEDIMGMAPAWREAATFDEFVALVREA